MVDEEPKVQPNLDLQRVDLQVAVRDVSTNMPKAVSSFPFAGNSRPAGRTDFEGRQLNEMVDLVQSANPEHLTSAGEGLWAARDAIKEAAEELNAHIDYVDWEGESGRSFRSWGKDLISKTRQLADFADTAGIQISVAGAGLASVVKAMPPRDNRSEAVKVTDFPPMKRLAVNELYDAAMKVEKDRQEAINQMNRLSSFYAVSEQNLAAQVSPVFEPMPKLGVPAPDPHWAKFKRDGDTPAASGTQRHPSDAGTLNGHYVAENLTSRAYLVGVHSPDHSTIAYPLQGSLTSPPVGTELNSITAPPAATPGQSIVTSPSTVSTTSPSNPAVRPLLPEFVAPPAVAGTRTPGAGDGAFRAGSVASVPAVGSGRGGVNPLGRAGAMEEGSPRTVTPSTGQMPMGRGVAGGTPRPGSTSSSRTGAPPAARGNGIVGGRPSTTTGGAPGSRMSSGAVVGGEGTPASVGSASRPGERGVVGATDRSSPESTQSNRRSLSNSDGVVGTPQRRATGARSARKGFTSGGEGLVRGRDQQPSEPDEDEAAYRPCHLDEAEEIRTSSCPSYVPPATN